MPLPFSQSYLAGEPRALGFLPLDFRDHEARIRHARRVAERPVSRALVAALEEQHAALPPSAARRAHLDALAQEGTAVVVTGQQVGLFLGPLYTLYKAASAIAVARAMEAESGVRCVPLFWLQTEDHDYPEIDHCHVPRPGSAPLRLQLSDGGGEAAARVSVAYRALGPELSGLLGELEGALGGLPFEREALALLARHYLPGRGMAAAFAGVLAELFAEEGLIVFDPRRAAVAALAAPVLARSIEECESIGAALAERNTALERAGHAVQVWLRERSPLCFFHEERAEGPRYRFERRNDRWALVGGERTVPLSEPQAILAREPLRFSSSALLRPIVQDALFPTAAYIGGPGELNYYAQLPPLHRHFGLPEPLFVPRARFRALDARTRALLTKTGLGAAEVERPRSELLARLGGRLPEGLPDASLVEELLLGDFPARLSSLETAMKELSGGMANPLRRTRATVERAVSRLRGRYERALLERDHVVAERIDRLQGMLFPEGTPQERYYSFAWFAALKGPRAFKDAVLSSLRPFEAGVAELCL